MVVNNLPVIQACKQNRRVYRIDEVLSIWAIQPIVKKVQHVRIRLQVVLNSSKSRRFNISEYSKHLFLYHF
jgi:hypothetical protein